jgi:hypothetical protein
MHSFRKIEILFVTIDITEDLRRTSSLLLPIGLPLFRVVLIDCSKRTTSTRGEVSFPHVFFPSLLLERRRVVFRICAIQNRMSVRWSLVLQNVNQ